MLNRSFDGSVLRRIRYHRGLRKVEGDLPIDWKSLCYQVAIVVD